jgi:hypothetical protein
MNFLYFWFAGAKLLERDGKLGDKGDSLNEPGKLRKRAAAFLDEDDQRYHGKKISRKALNNGQLSQYLLQFALNILSDLQFQ